MGTLLLRHGCLFKKYMVGVMENGFGYGNVGMEI